MINQIYNYESASSELINYISSNGVTSKEREKIKSITEKLLKTVSEKNQNDSISSKSRTYVICFQDANELNRLFLRGSANLGVRTQATNPVSVSWDKGIMLSHGMLDTKNYFTQFIKLEVPKGKEDEFEFKFLLSDKDWEELPNNSNRNLKDAIFNIKTDRWELEVKQIRFNGENFI